MITVYNPAHQAHWGRSEFYCGKVIDCYEVPGRAERIVHALRELNLGPIICPEPIDRDLLHRVHDADYLHFLETIYPHWAAENCETDALPYVFSRRSDGLPAAMAIARLGQFATDVCSPITAHSWNAALASAASASHAAGLLQSGEHGVLALCRPPGHHAGRRTYGGYCFLNNGALAAERLLAEGAKRVAILDIDNHHGNGAQEIFYDRGDVFTTSIHGTPRMQFPWFSGFDDETGSGAGKGFNLNRSLCAGTSVTAYAEVLADVIDRIREFRPDALIVALGVDAGENDPTSQLCIDTAGFRRFGGYIADLAIPTLFVMEGGYNLDQISIDVCAVLTGWLDARG
jgi:acetoin utilization deacetylase AcuC-like enzyme